VAEIHPFRGMHYNQELVGDLSSVICPPYDVIPSQLQEELHHRSQHNFIRLEYGRELPQDTATDNKYTRSASTLEEWLEQGVLEVDETPAIYLHDHYFTYRGKEYKRRGIVVRVRLEEWDRRIIRPHEGTLTEAKGDRLSLLWALRANTSPILAMFEDEEQRVSSLLAAQETDKPLLSSGDVDGERHRVRAITRPEVVNSICGYLANQPLYIADGHHRYESALAYQRERRTSYSSLSGDEAFNFVMMTLVDFADAGLIVLPPHRLVRGIAKATLDGLMAKLEMFFEIEKLPLSMSDVWQRVDDSLTGDAGRLGVILFGLDSEHLFVLWLRDFAAASQMMPYFHSELYKKLDVSIVDHVILEKLLGLSSGREEARITYGYDRLDAVSRVLDQEYQLALLLSPARIGTIKAIADAGDQMPRKSTYFYPKTPAGLILNQVG
jgi:uncharacterized protein (DUF1015 family)